MSRKTLSRWLLAGLVAAFAAAAGWPLVRSDATVSANPLAEANAYCLPGPAEARVGPGEKPDRIISVDVPVGSRPFGLASSIEYAVAQGDIVQFTVASPQPGAIAVHGLSDIEPVQVGGRVTMAFRAIYSGRFPLHFHGADGSHFEIVALNILPREMPDAGSPRTARDVAKVR